MVTHLDDAGLGSLRQAIEDANLVPGLDEIHFNYITGTPPPYTIDVNTALPVIDDPVYIDATTQPGHIDAPIIILHENTSGSGSMNGFEITAGASIIKGFEFNGSFVNGIYIHDGDSTVVENNIFWGWYDGVRIENSSYNIIGRGNIFNEMAECISIRGSGATNNSIYGNIIGPILTEYNTNNHNGIYINDASGTVIGGFTD